MKTTRRISYWRVLFALCFALTLGLFLGLAPTASAASINVGCNVTELVNAITTANVNAGADTLELASNCSYTLTTVNNVDAARGPNGLPVVTSNITINGNHATITRKANAPAFRLVQVNSGASLTLITVSLSGGQAATGPNSEGDGGGIYNSGTLTCNHSQVSRNTGGLSDTPSVQGNGGGIYNTGTLTLENCTVSSNEAGAAEWNNALQQMGNPGDGGGIYNAGTTNLDHSALSSNHAGSDSHAPPGNGGGIYNTGMLNVTFSTLQSNTTGQSMYYSGSGGAIFNANGTVNMTNSTVADNSPGPTSMDGGSCGGIDNVGGTLDITASTFSGNYAAAAAGAICSDGVLSVTDSVFSGNSGLEGGAINATSGTVKNSTFIGNTAHIEPTHCHCGGGFGGAINGGILVLNSTFLNNTADQFGGALYGSDGLQVVNSTIVNNTASRLLGGSGTSGGIEGGLVRNSIIANNVNGNCSNVADGGGNIRFPRSDTSCVGTFGNPKLGPLQDNGGATQTMSLAPDSQAINSGLDANCPATDQRGIARPQGKHCDSGAFELEPPTAITLVAPPDGKKLNQPQVNLKWNPAQRVAWYRVVVNQDTVQGPKVVNVKVETTRFKTPALESGHWYYWRVKACSKVACTTSTVWRFRVKME